MFFTFSIHLKSSWGIINKIRGRDESQEAKKGANHMECKSYHIIWSANHIISYGVKHYFFFQKQTKAFE